MMSKLRRHSAQQNLRVHSFKGSPKKTNPYMDAHRPQSEVPSPGHSVSIKGKEKKQF